MDCKEQVIEFSKQTSPAGKDTKYNKGRRDCLQGNIYSEEAHYFLQCAGYSGLGANFLAH